METLEILVEIEYLRKRLNILARIGVTFPLGQPEGYSSMFYYENKYFLAYLLSHLSLFHYFFKVYFT